MTFSKLLVSILLSIFPLFITLSHAETHLSAKQSTSGINTTLISHAPVNKTNTNNPNKDKETFSQLQKKAEQGDAHAQFKLGQMYINGFGTPKNAQQAFNWYRKAAQQGFDQAQLNLGLMYEYGVGTSKNNQQAIHWLKKAAELGYSSAKRELKKLTHT